MFRLLSLVGNLVNEDVINDIILLVHYSEELYEYSTKKLYNLMKDHDSLNVIQILLLLGWLTNRLFLEFRRAFSTFN